MLTIPESKVIFKFISLSNLFFCTFPFTVDEKTGKLQKLSAKRKVLWYVFLLLSSLHTGYAVYHMIKLIVEDSAVIPPHVFSVQLDITYIPVLVLSLTLYASFSGLDVTMLTFNQLYNGKFFISGM